MKQRDNPLHPFAAALTRSGAPCKSPAMPNGRCRMHGGTSPGAPSGPANGGWKHGLRSAEVIERRRRAVANGRALRDDVERLSRIAADKP